MHFQMILMWHQMPLRFRQKADCRIARQETKPISGILPMQILPALADLLFVFFSPILLN